MAPWTAMRRLLLLLLLLLALGFSEKQADQTNESDTDSKSPERSQQIPTVNPVERLLLVEREEHEWEPHPLGEGDEVPYKEDAIVDGSSRDRASLVTLHP
ncbi:unnamed protein product [Lampetra fluviatilis]